MYQTKINIIITAAACILILGGCKEETIELTGISVSPKSVSLVFGGTPNSQQITATPIPENATGFTFTWTSDREEVATVSPQGLVTATGPGTTEVAVKSGNWVRKVPVTVTDTEEAGVLQGADTRNTGGWNWKKAGDADYKVSVNRLEMRIARSMLNLPGQISMEFKWSDNMQEDGNIMDFYLNGDVAPGERFNYVYNEK